jgi:hypothetical protein
VDRRDLKAVQAVVSGLVRLIGAIDPHGRPALAQAIEDWIIESRRFNGFPAWADVQAHQPLELLEEVNVGGPAVLIGAVHVFPGLRFAQPSVLTYPAAFFQAAVPGLGEHHPGEGADDSDGGHSQGDPERCICHAPEAWQN